MLKINWQKTVPQSYGIAATSLVAIYAQNKIIFAGHDGSDQGQLENITESNKVLFFTQESSECLVILNNDSLTIMARTPLKIVGESEME